MSIALYISDLVASVIFVLTEYADGNANMKGSKALWLMAEQIVTGIITRMLSSNSPESFNKMIQTPGTRNNIIQFAVSAISSTVMRRGKIFSHALNSIGSTCLAKDVTVSFTATGDYPIFGK